MVQFRTSTTVVAGLISGIFCAMLYGAPASGYETLVAPAIRKADSMVQLAAAGRVAGVDHAPEINRLIAAAREKSEKELDLTWDGAALGGSEGAKKLEALFNRMYGMNIKVNFTPGPTMPQMTAKVVQEVVAARKSSTDVLLGTVEHFSAVLDKNVLEEYDYSKLSLRVAKKMVAPKNIGVEIYSSAGGIVYDTRAIPPGEVPKKLEDVLKPKWKGRIASTPYAAYFDRVAVRPEWGPEKMIAFITKLSDYTGGLIRVNEVSRIISGEFVMLVMGSGQEVTLEKARGAPVDFVIPEDSAAVHFAYMGVPRTAAHPNLSKLFINTIVSDEGQKILYESFATDHHELPGSQFVSKLADLKARGIQTLRVDVKFSVDHPEMRQIQPELVKILSRKSGR
jgi:iron(III) transport system substrate-binding protein